ncbi:hypothetical protein [Candidatus Amarolinea aalborgensis]|uniref:hypothetical protein n=1 Tax=Candidatus Amarolinea aalborgensis TaxID=2249329 RepID=UPI003BF9F18A
MKSRLMGAPPGVRLPFDKRSTEPSASSVEPLAEGSGQAWTQGRSAFGRPGGGTPLRPEFIRRLQSAQHA